ncbi:MAG: hypothetical protein LBC40_05625 [Dysgonamonadaceae bacterium]|jgi:hypothetical protein|nr:hypothetical protein [Dysgonamonadaceae bacterium]
MKKLVLFFAVAAALSFAACSNAPKQEEATTEPVVESVVPEAPEAAAVEVAPEAAQEAAPAAE